MSAALASTIVGAVGWAPEKPGQLCLEPNLLPAMHVIPVMHVMHVIPVMHMFEPHL